MSNLLSQIPPQYLYLTAIWSLIWKGTALWFAARQKEKIWYVAILIINTLGILEIIYLAYKTDFFRTSLAKVKSLRK